MIAIIKKFIPDLTHTEIEGEGGIGETRIIIVRPGAKEQAGSRPEISIIRPGGTDGNKTETVSG